jgi:hypothetical protein
LKIWSNNPYIFLSNFCCNEKFKLGLSLHNGSGKRVGFRIREKADVTLSSSKSWLIDVVEVFLREIEPSWGWGKFKSLEIVFIWACWLVFVCWSFGVRVSVTCELIWGWLRWFGASRKCVVRRNVHACWSKPESGWFWISNE